MHDGAALEVPPHPPSNKGMIIELIERLTREAAKRDMEFLVIGGHAIGLLGHARLTMAV